MIDQQLLNYLLFFEERRPEESKRRQIYCWEFYCIDRIDDETKIIRMQTNGYYYDKIEDIRRRKWKKKKQ